MKKNKYKRLFIDLGIIAIVFVITLFTFPIFSTLIQNFIEKQSETIFNAIKKSTALEITYQELSPALLSKLSLKNVSIKDLEGNKIASFENIELEYSLWEIIRGNYKAYIKQITIRDGQIIYDKSKESSFFQKLFSENDKDKKEIVIKEQNNFNLPFENFKIRLQNICLLHNTKDFDATLNIFLGDIISKGKNITYNLNSNASLFFKQKKYCNDSSFDFIVNGTTVSDLSYLSAVLKINALRVDKTRIVNTSFFVSLKDNIVSCLAFQQKQNMDIRASYNLANKKGNASIKFDRLQFSDLFNSGLGKYSFLNTVIFDGSLSVAFDLADNAREKVKYSSDLLIKSDMLNIKAVHAKNIALKLQLVGSEKYISVQNFILRSNILNLNASADYNFINSNILLNASIDKLLLAKTKIQTKINVYGSKKGYFCTLKDSHIGRASIEETKITVYPEGNNYNISLTLNDQLGEYKLDATYARNKDANNFLEVHGVLNSVSVKTIFELSSDFIQVEDLAFIDTVLEPFRITSEFYISSDLKSFSYNVIQLVLASTEAKGMYVLSSFSGSDSDFTLESFNLNIADKQINGTLNASFGSENDVFFNSLFSVEGISYTANGIYANNMLNIYGDYGLSITATLEKDGLHGNFALNDFPLPVLPFVFSTASDFTFKNPQEWKVELEQARLSYTKNALLESYNQIPFQLSFKGNISPKNIFLSEIEMGNNESKLKGQASFDSISNDFDFLKQFSVIAKLESEDKKQSFDLNCNFSLAEEVFMDGVCNIENISLATFSNSQAKSDIINATLTFLGTPENLLLQANLQKLKIHVNNKPLEASCLFLIDDGTVRIPDASVSWSGHQISSLDVSFRPEEGKGKLSLNYSGMIANDKANADLSFDIVGKKVVEGNTKMSTVEKLVSVAESFVLNVTAKNVYLGEKVLRKPFKFTVSRDKDTIAFYDVENRITGFYIDDGTFSLNMADDFPTHLSFDGKISNNTINLQCYNIRLDLPQILAFLPIDGYVHFDTGNLNGELLIEGKLNEPQFYGTLYLDDANFHSPDYAPDNLKADNIPIIFEKYFIHLKRTAFIAKNFELEVECTSEFEGWIPYDTVVKCYIDKNRPGHMKTKNLLFHADGDVACDIQMNISPDAMYLSGKAAFDKGNFSIAFDTFDEFNARKKSGSKPYPFSMDLEVSLGNRAEYNWPNMKAPILHTLIPTEKPIVFHIAPEAFTITGLATMRGGEITYIKRNFYIKEGTIKFLETVDGFTALLSLRAEIRDKDMDGKAVKLILNLEDQPLVDNYDSWISKITAEPAKSEEEILKLLGQLVTADMNKKTIIKDTLTNATDFASQITVAKNIENAVRNFFKLDVLSLRTQVLQNLVFGNLFKEQGQANLKIGDYLDNTSLYIGKYFGSAIYADATLHLSNYNPTFDRTANVPKAVYKSILFEPEIGLEMATPFFNLRWAVSPTNIDALFVDSTSLTFSWNFSY